MHDPTTVHAVHEALDRITRFASETERDAIAKIMERANRRIQAALEAQEAQRAAPAADSAGGPSGNLG